MLNLYEATQAIKKAEKVFINTRISEHDMALLKGVKIDILQYIGEMRLQGTTEFNIMVCDDGDVIIG